MLGEIECHLKRFRRVRGIELDAGDLVQSCGGVVCAVGLTPAGAADRTGCDVHRLTADPRQSLPGESFDQARRVRREAPHSAHVAR